MMTAVHAIRKRVLLPAICRFPTRQRRLATGKASAYVGTGEKHEVLRLAAQHNVVRDEVGRSAVKRVRQSRLRSCRSTMLVLT